MLTTTDRRRRRGNAALFAAFMLMPLSLLAGIGIDFGRTASAEARLSQAVDGAALAGGRMLTSGDPKAEAEEYFKANFNADAERTKIDPLVVTAGDSDRILTVRATGRIATTFLQLAGAEWASMPIEATATARRKTLGIELAMVLDVTGSMAGSAMTSLRAASTDLINILFGPQTSVDNLFVSVVPYVASVNFGTNRVSWLEDGKIDQLPYSPHAWRGCVDARTDGEDETDTTPVPPLNGKGNDDDDDRGDDDDDDDDDDDGANPLVKPFKPFFYRSGLIGGINEYGPTAPATDRSSTTPAQSYTGSDSNTGPNLGCGQPMTGLITNRDQLLAVIAALQPSRRGGTIAPLGLQAGWMTLSPKWRGLWGTNAWGSTTPAGLPLDYNTPYMQKVIIMMTDGNNQWNGNDYNAYGQPQDRRLGVSPNNTKAEIDKRMSRMCTRIKATGIVIYTITLGSLQSSTQKLYRDCATEPSYYFSAPSSSQLRSVFQQIGTQLSNLRLEK